MKMLRSPLSKALRAKRSSWLAPRKCTALVALSLKVMPLQAQPTMEWATVVGTAQEDGITCMAVGPAGQLYLAGAFGWSGIMNPVENVLYGFDSSGAQTLSQAWRGEVVNAILVGPAGTYCETGFVNAPDVLGAGRMWDFYLAKHAPDGSLLWERSAGTQRDSSRSAAKDWQAGNAMAMDAEGNIYVAGRSVGPAVFGNTTFPNTPGGPLICKFAPDGTMLWAKRAEGKGFIIDGVVYGSGAASSISLDPEGNAVLRGNMSIGTANFDGNVINIVGPNDSGDFVAKYSSGGQILWAKSVPFGSMALDGLGNVVISGAMTNGQVKLDGTFTSVDDPLHRNFFVAKYNPSGALLWAKAAPAGGLAVDRQGNIYSGTSKLDSAGNLLWERIVPEASLNVATFTAADEPVFSGLFAGTVQLDKYEVQADSDNNEDVLVCKADANGAFQWAIGFVSGDNRITLRAPVSDLAGSLYLAGGILGSGTSMLGSVPISVQFGGNSDFFISRITEPAPVSVELKIALVASAVTISWPVVATNCILEAASSLPAVSWMTVTNTLTIGTTECSVQVPLAGDAKFFRLRRQ